MLSIFSSLDLLGAGVYILETKTEGMELEYSFFFFKRFYLFFFREKEGREKERKRNINVWLPLVCSPLGAWPATQACGLIGNQTSDPLVCRLMLNLLSHTSQGRTWIFIKYHSIGRSNIICKYIIYIHIYIHPSIYSSIHPYIHTFSYCLKRTITILGLRRKGKLIQSQCPGSFFPLTYKVLPRDILLFLGDTGS